MLDNFGRNFACKKYGRLFIFSLEKIQIFRIITSCFNSDKLLFRYPHYSLISPIYSEKNSFCAMLYLFENINVFNFRFSNKILWLCCRLVEHYISEKIFLLKQFLNGGKFTRRNFKPLQYLPNVS